MQTREFYDILEEFITVMIHAVCYARNLYPSHTFSRVRHYNTATYQNVHPGVQKWAENTAKVCVNTLRAYNKAESLSFVVLSNNSPVERFVLDLSHLTASSNTDMNAIDLQAQFRAALTMILENFGCDEPAFCDIDDRVLTVAFTGQFNDLDNDNPWVSARQLEEPPQRATVTPIKFIQAGPMSMGIYYQKHNST